MSSSKFNIKVLESKHESPLGELDAGFVEAVGSVERAQALALQRLESPQKQVRLNLPAGDAEEALLRLQLVERVHGGEGSVIPGVGVDLSSKSTGTFEHYS